MTKKDKISLGIAVGAAAAVWFLERRLNNSGTAGIGALGLRSARNRDLAKKDLVNRISRVKNSLNKVWDDNTVWKEKSSVKSLAYYAGGQTDEAWNDAEKLNDKYNDELSKAAEHLTNAIVIVDNI